MSAIKIPRRIVQISGATAAPDGDAYDALALADDGSLWGLVLASKDGTKWVAITALPDREEDHDNVPF